MIARGQKTSTTQRWTNLPKATPSALPQHFARLLAAILRALQDAGAYDEGIAAAQALAERSPDDVLAYTALSILYQHKGLIPEAEQAATRAKLLSWKQQLRAQASGTE